MFPAYWMFIQPTFYAPCNICHTIINTTILAPYLHAHLKPTFTQFSTLPLLPQQLPPHNTSFSSFQPPAPLHSHPPSLFYSVILFLWKTPGTSGIHPARLSQKNSPLGGSASGSSRLPAHTYRNFSAAGAPYSRMKLPHSPQNSRVRDVPEPLSAVCSFGVPFVYLNADTGSLVVRP